MLVDTKYRHLRKLDAIHTCLLLETEFAQSQTYFAFLIYDLFIVNIIKFLYCKAGKRFEKQWLFE